MEKITTHKTYLVLGSFPKFHIESLGGTFFGGTRTFGILMLNVLSGNFVFSWCFLALEPCLRRNYLFLLLFPSPQWSRLNVWVLFFLFFILPKSIDDKGSWASKDGWLDWVRFSTAYCGRYMNRFVHKSHKAPQDKNVIPPK